MMIVVGIGHKARQGKDYFCKYLVERGVQNAHIHIIHFADALYEEVRNIERKYPLIQIEPYSTEGRRFFSILHNSATGSRLTNSFEYCPSLEKLMQQRNITKYWGMDEKDSEILQIWGTDIRRNYFDPDYWVKRLEKKLQAISLLPGNHLVLIPDTRFLNELALIINYGGYYVEVARINEDGSRYIAKDRDPQHRSETELDQAPAHYFATCYSGDLDRLKAHAESFAYLVASSFTANKNSTIGNI